MKFSKYNLSNYILILLLILIFVLAYHETILGLNNLWKSDGNYSYAYIIPFISIYMIFEKRKEIKSTPLSTNLVGGILFVFFLIGSAYGILGSSPSAVRIAIPLLILSIALFCFGWKMFKVLLLPLSLLIFMVPLPTMYGTLVGVHLRRISTILGELILRLFGVSVFVEGNIIDIGVTQLQVVDACSGLRYVLPLLCIGVIFAYYFEKSRWKQIILVISTIPIAIVTNGIRIGITGILAERYGPEMADGFFHGFSGWLIFMFAFALLFGFYFLLKILFPQKNVFPKRVVKKEPETKESLSTLNSFPILITMIGLLCLVGLSFSTNSLPPIKIEKGFSSFPLKIMDWTGSSERIDTEIVKLSGAEEAFSSTYFNNTGELVSLYIGYRGSPFVESENFFHSPNVCLPSSGWKTKFIDKHTIENVPIFGSIVVKEMISEKMGSKQLIYYWFQTKSKTSYDVNINRYHLSIHAFTRDNTYDLFIRPITPIKTHETIENAENRLDQFVRDMMDTLQIFIAENQVADS